jgi:PAS domain S-box-containing protein
MPNGLNLKEYRSPPDARLSEERYLAFVRQSSEGIWRFEVDQPIPVDQPETRLIEDFFRLAYLAECNDAMAGMYGYSRAEEIRGIRLRELVPPSNPKNIAYLQHFIRGGFRLRDGESHEVDKYGLPKYFINNLYGVIEEGCLVRVWGTQRDVTEARRIQDALKQSEGQFRQLADTMPQIVWVSRADGYHEYFNQRWYQYTGLSEDESLGRQWNCLHPDDRERTAKRWHYALETTEPYEIEYRLKSQTGQYRWFLNRAMPVRDEYGRVLRWFGTCTDIDDYKRMVDALRLSEERFRLSAEAFNGIIYDWDLTTERVERTRGNFEVTGYHIHEIEPRRDWWVQRIHPEDTSLVEQALAQSILFGKPGFDVEYRIRHRDGHYVWVWDKGLILRNSELRAVRVVGNCVDITARKRAEEALKDADRRKDEFLATLAHELRNPLAPIRNALHIMQKKNAAPAMLEEARDMMQRQVGQMVRLVDDLLDVSRITLGKLELRRQPVTLQEAILGALETSGPLIEATGHRLVTQITGVPLRVDGDLARLSQVFANLLNNAAKYTNPGGQITLCLKAEQYEAVISVRDTGIGIPPEMLPRIFDMFTQVDNSLEKAQGGLGIGLTLVKSLVEMHNGRIEAISEGLGKGSAFTVRLPLLEAEAAPAPQPTAMSETDCPARRVLVVDDNVASAKTMGWTLELLGSEVCVVHDGPAALAEARQFKPDLVLLDIGLPGMNGYDVCRALRKEPGMEQMVLVAQTGWGQEEHRQRSREAGFDHHLVKPVEMDDLKRLLQGD